MFIIILGVNDETETNRALLTGGITTTGVSGEDDDPTPHPASKMTILETRKGR